MTIASIVSRNDYTLNGSTVVYPYTFRILAAADLQVVRRGAGTGAEVVLSYPADYAVSGVGNSSGGAVTLVNPGTASDILSIRRNRALKQETSFRSQGAFFPEMHEDAVDALLTIDQQQQDALDRTLKLLTSLSPVGRNLSLSPDAGKAIVGDGVGFTMATIDSSAASAAIPGNSRTVATLTAYLSNNAVFNPRDYGAVGNNVADDTTKYANCIAAAIAAGANAAMVPVGSFVITSQLTIPTGFTFVGLSGTKSILVHRPTADGICLKVTAGAAVSYNNTVRNFSVYSDDLTFTKVAIEASDVSSFAFSDILVYGTGSGIASFYEGGTGSIALRTKGRDSMSLQRLKLVAQKPWVIAANPNTTRDAGEDIDHVHASDFYLVAKGNYSIAADDGIGIISLTMDGYQAWVGGTGGFYMNDTRVAPTIPSRHLAFHNVRGEQCTDPNGYWFNILSTFPIQTLEIRNTLGASTAQGIKVNGALQILLDNVTMATAAGKNSLLVSGAQGDSSISMRGCKWQFGSVFTLTGYIASSITANDAALSAGPTTATYVNQLVGTGINVEHLQATAANGAEALFLTAITGDAFQVFCNAAGAGITERVLTNNKADFGGTRTMIASAYDLQTRTGVATAASALQVDTSGNVLAQKDLKVAIVGKGIYIKEGVNATMGRATLVGGTVTVATTKVTSNSEILLTHQNAGGTVGFVVVSARVAGTSFTILSSNAGDTSLISWVILEPA